MSDHKPQETPDALAAFEAYWIMGDGRSLAKLAVVYAGQTEGEPPTRDLCTLERWSAAHGWQDRLRERIAEEAEAVRAETRKALARVRRRLLVALEADTNRYIDALASGEKPMMAEDAASLDRVTKLLFSLGEDPLPDRRDIGVVGGAGAVSFQVVQFGPDDLGAGVGGNGDDPPSDTAPDDPPPPDTEPGGNGDDDTGPP